MGTVDHRRQLGQRGEQAAARYLVSQGYQLLDRNWRCRLGEIDLVLTYEDQIIFVEVRTRAGFRYGSGAESVVRNKQLRLRQLALAYLREKRLSPEAKLRFDVVSIQLLDDGRYEIDHIQHAF
jgi:putative endonuclease